jgi:predicted metal-dependent hydrolase
MIIKQQHHHLNNMDNYFLGEKYDIINIDNFIDIDIDNKKIYINSEEDLEKLYRKKAEEIFSQRLEVMFHRFEENINYPKLKVRDMKTRWGVCNRKNKTITLNLNLIKYDLEKIDYVIVHELCHLVYFDHSNNFWLLVHKYIPNYKQIRKSLRD